MTRFAVVAVSLSFVPVALAQVSGEADALKLRRAREAYAAGQALYNQGSFADAVAKFEEANTLAPRAGNLFNIGRCYEQLKETPHALKAYREYLRLSPDAKEKPEVDSAIAQLEAQLRQRGVQQVVVRAEPEGKARVRIDGRDAGFAPVVIELSRGVHAIEVSAEGFSTARQDFNVSLEHASDLSFTLERLAGVPFTDDWKPPPPPPLTPSLDVGGVPGVAMAPPPSRKPYVWAWVTSGLTLVAVAAGVVMGVLELNAQKELKDGTGGFSRTRELATTATTLSWGANAGYIAGGVFGLTSILLFIFEGK